MSWRAVAWADELGDDGARRAWADTDTDVVLYRTADGAAHAADSRCPRRGYPLWEAAVTGSGLRSSIDGWAWSSDGAATDPDGLGHGDRPDLILRHYPTCELAGLLLVWVDGATGPTGPRPGAPDLAVDDHEPVAVVIDAEETGAASARTVSGAGHPHAALDSVADPHTLGFLLGAPTPRELWVRADGPALLHLQFELQDSDHARCIEVRAFGPYLLSVSDGESGGATLAVTPGGNDGVVEIRAATWRKDPTEPPRTDWPAFARRASALLRSVDRTAERLEPEAGSGLAVARAWAGSR